MTNPNGFRGRYTIDTAVVGQVGMAILDDGSIWLVLLCGRMGARLADYSPIQVKGPTNRVP